MPHPSRTLSRSSTILRVLGCTRLFFDTAFFQQPELLGLRELSAVVFAHRHFGQDLVKIVPAQGLNPFGSQHLVGSLADLHKRGVERSAAQIVNQNHARYFGFVAVLDAGGGWFIQQADHVAAGQRGKPPR